MAKLGASAGWGDNYVETITASQTLSYNDSGKVMLVGTDALTITLPATKAGIRYTFVNSGADANNIITISPNSSDGIWGTITLAGSVVDLGGVDDKDLINTKSSSIKGDTVTIIGDGSVGWYVISSTGVWAAEA
jgi:hypothetical protein|tara:strand:- start:22 stop:423 length:402 start_codon:yes stop_codon:yes gene_type:complete